MGTERRALVTGAAGFIGSHLVEALVRRGSAVRAFVRYTSRAEIGRLADLEPDVLAEIEVVAGDLRDADAVRDAARGCAAVFHLGALIGIPYSYAHPADVVETNVRGTLHVLLAAREAGSERVVHTSTSEVYGNPRTTPMSEDHPLSARSPYAASKTGADQLATSFARSFGLPVVTLRPFNTFGPRQSARAVIPTIVSQALASERVRLGALTPRRDFTFVSDTVEGFVRAGAIEGLAGETIHLGTGHDVSIGELAERILARVGRRVPIELDEQRLRPSDGEVSQLVSDPRKAKSLLGWEPQVSLDEGLDRTVAWIADHLERYDVGRYAV